MQSVTEIYARSIRQLGEGEKLELATLILEDISQSKKKKTNGHANGNGGLKELFGSVSLGHPTGADNESIDADLAREYASRHEDED